MNKHTDKHTRHTTHDTRHHRSPRALKSKRQELALPRVPRLARRAPVDGLPGEVPPLRQRRQRRHRLLGDEVAILNPDANGPLREGALRRGVPQGEQQLGRLGVAPPQLHEDQAAAIGVGGDAVDGRDEARLVLADDELHVRVRGELELTRRHARAHPLAEGVGRDRCRAARLHLPEARLRFGIVIAELGGALVRAKVEQAVAVLDDHARRLLEEAPAAVAMQARVRVGGALGRRVRHEQRVRARVKVPGVDGLERDAEARAVLLGGEGLLRQAEEVDHHADRAVRRVVLGLGEHDLQEGQQPAQLRAEPVGVEPVEPRLEAPEVVRGDEGGGRHVLPAARHDAAALGEGDEVLEVDERRVVDEGLDGASAKVGP
eukprot:scaffold34525_cov56-Phaeocystis_antarctica.AAC.1